MKHKFLLTISFIFIFLLLTFTFLVQFPSTFTIPETCTYEYSNVLRKANEENPQFGDQPLTEISLLASHDALSYNINYFSDFNIYDNAFDVPMIVKYLGKGAVKRYAKAQNHDIYTQLTAGARWIDARIDFQNNDYYTSHTLISNRLEPSLIQILKFLDENPGEFIIFQIGNVYTGNESTFWNDLANYFSSVEYNNKCIYDYINYDLSIKSAHDLTYNLLTKNGTKSGVLIHKSTNKYGEITNEYKDYFNETTIDGNWNNKSNTKDLITSMTNQLNKIDTNTTNFRENETQLSPTAHDWFNTLLGWGLLSMGKHHNPKVLESIDIEYALNKMPIYLCDYLTSTYKDFNKNINRAILTHNLNLK